MPTLLSVIIPALNEARGISDTLESVASQDEDHEILVVDGGSTDGTAHVARRYARVLDAPTGRARQMNAGADAARGDVLLFLHADTILPAGALRRVRTALGDPSVSGGAFRLRFDRDTPLLRFYSFCTRFPVPALCFGDRALFVRRRAFDEVGGYPDVPLFEDLELVRQIDEHGRFAFLEQTVTTSARRFRAVGPLRQQLKNTFLWLHYLAGTDPHRLSGRYPYRRGEEARHPARPSRV